MSGAFHNSLDSDDILCNFIRKINKYKDFFWDMEISERIGDSKSGEHSVSYST